MDPLRNQAVSKTASKCEEKEMTSQHSTWWSEWIQRTESTQHHTYKCPSAPFLVNCRFPTADQEVTNAERHEAKDFARLPRAVEQLLKGYEGRLPQELASWLHYLKHLGPWTNQSSPSSLGCYNKGNIIAVRSTQ